MRSHRIALKFLHGVAGTDNEHLQGLKNQAKNSQYDVADASLNGSRWHGFIGNNRDFAG